MMRALCRSRGAAALGLALALFASAAQAQDRGTLLAQVSGRRAYEHVLALSQRIGPHVAGSPADRTSGEYIAAQLARGGYAVEWQPFPFPYFEARRVTLTVPQSPGLALHPNVLSYSPSTPAGGVTARVVDAGLGRPADFAGGAAAGRIALIRRGELTFRQKAENAAAAGAVAVIIYNSKPDRFVGTLRGAGSETPLRLSVAGLSGDEGDLLLARLRSTGLTVHLDVQTVNEQRTSWNLIGTKPGRDLHRVLVVGAHRDTVEGAPGANDNSSGVATALEVAEVLARVPLGITVRFVFFGAEELGLFGSAYYTAHPGPDPIIGMINLDMEGVGERLRVSGGRTNDSLVRTAARLAADLGVRVETGQREGGSDHVNFDRIGVPVVFLFRPDDPYYDTPRDTVDRVQPPLLEASARLALALVLEVAGIGK